MPLVFIILFLLFSFSTSYGGFIVGHADTTLSSIPTKWINAAKDQLKIAYNHTSHGSQIITGMNGLRDFPSFGNRYLWGGSMNNNSLLSLADSGIPGIADLSQGDDVDPSDPDSVTLWARDTYNYLINSSNYHINVIIWSWCNIGGHDIPNYLNSMEWLISLFGEGGSHARAASHPVKFVFMTGHANGGGVGDSSDNRNEQIRKHCKDNDRILFDFADIENYDPDDNYFLDKMVDDALYYDSTPPPTSGGRNANWATQYLTRHPGSELDLLVNGTTGYSGCGNCSHSPEGGETADARLNCILKGRAIWSLFARLAGWNPGTEPPSPPQPPPSGNSYYPGQLILLLSK